MNFSAESRVLIQGITEPLGSVYTPLMLSYNTQVVAGVCPGYGGEDRYGIPVFDLVGQAVEQVGMVDATVIFVHPYRAVDAALEAIAAGIRQIILIPQGIPPLDMVHLLRKADATETLVIGANCPGLIVPDQVLLGTHPSQFYRSGSVGVISRCGPLTYEVAHELSKAGFGQSIVVGIGGDRIVGSSFQQWLQILEEDEHTEAIVLVGEIGGDSEEVAAQYITEAIDKPVIAYIAGSTAPRGHVIGHAGAIVAAQVSHLNADVGTAKSKIAALRSAQVAVAERPSQIPDLVKKVKI
jgi:succinyl-CoA synthetase alpha subunit